MIRRIKTLWYLSGMDRNKLIDFFHSYRLPEATEDVYSITSSAGGEIIMPSPIKKMFDEGKVTSIGDIL
jgi:hypothetical protein